jgi:hypothetical protein
MLGLGRKVSLVDVDGQRVAELLTLGMALGLVKDCSRDLGINDPNQAADFWENAKTNPYYRILDNLF